MSDWMPSFSVDPDAGGAGTRRKRARIIEGKRICAGGCRTVLNSYNEGRHCNACRRRLGIRGVTRGR